MAEVFGDAVGDGHAEVGMGIRRFRDPALREAFAAEPLALDVAPPAETGAGGAVPVPVPVPELVVAHVRGSWGRLVA